MNARIEKLSKSVEQHQVIISELLKKVKAQNLQQELIEKYSSIVIQ